MGHLRLLLGQRLVLKRRALGSTLSELLVPVGILFLLVLLSKISDVIDKPADNYAEIPEYDANHQSYSQARPYALQHFMVPRNDSDPVILASPQLSLPIVCRDHKIAIVPEGPEVTAFLDWAHTLPWWSLCLNNPATFPTEDDAIEWVRTDGAGVLMAVIKLDTMDTSAHKYEYTIRVNNTVVPRTRTIIDDFVLGRSTTFQKYFYSGFLTIIQLMDIYIVCLENGNNCDVTALEITFGSAQCPFPVESYKQNPFFDAAGGFVALVFSLAFIFPFSKIVKGLVEEKELRLKEGMLMMGLNPASYPLSWLVTTTVEQFTGSFLATVVMRMLFTKGDFLLIFILILLFNLSSVGVCFFLGSLFSKSRTASLFSVLYLFVNVLPILVLPDDIINSVKGILGLMLAMGFGYAIQQVTGLEGVARGAAWSDVWHGDYPIGLSIILLLSDVFFYHFLAWYCGHIIPGEFGVPKKPWFLFTREYWRPDSEDEGEHLSRPKAVASCSPPDNLIEQVASAQALDGKVHISGLRRVFEGNAVAVQGLDLTMYEGQITVLLGHNGAGKTTTINMLTGMLPVTAGDAVIYGHSILNGMQAIRKICGVCPQHNILWPTYTVSEHLRFFARLKGMPEAQVEPAVKKMLGEIKLEDKADVYSSALSGGMKRRLSVGIALIADSRIVFLDEPTAGMDPEAREYTHSLLSANTAGRVIVLTTHFMDEADKLGDRIAIMSKGALRCCGSPLFLKARLGVGYNLTVALRSREASAAVSPRIAEIIKRHVPSAIVQPVTGMELPYLLPMDSVGQFADLFRALEDKTEEMQIDTFGISMTKLEDVFMKIALESEAQQEEEEDSDDEANPERQSLVQGDKKTKGAGAGEFVASLDDYQLATGSRLFVGQFQALLVKRFHCARRDRKFIFCLVCLPVLVIIGALCLTFITIPNNDLPLTPLQFYTATGLPGEVVVAGNPSLPGLEWPASEYGTGALSLINATTAANAQTSVDVTEYLFDGYYKHKPTNRFGGVVFQDVIAEICCFEDSLGLVYNKTGPFRFPITMDTVMHNSTGRHALPTFYAELNKARLRALLNPALNRTARAHPLPQSARDQARIDTFKLVGAAIIILFPFTFIPANFAAFLVKERACKAKHVQLVSGVSVWAYWLSSFVWDLFLYSITVILSILTFAAFKKTEYVGDAEKVFATALLFTAYGMASTALAYLCQFPFQNHSAAQNVLMMGNLVFGVFLVIAARIMSTIDSTKDTNETLMKFYRFVPSYCLGEGLLQLSLKPLLDLFQPDNQGIFSADYLGRPLSYLAVEIPVFFLLTLLCDWPGLRRLRSDGFFVSRRMRKAIAPLNGVSSGTEEDSDVVAERREVETPGGRQEDLVTVQRLRKVYPPAGNSPPKVAVEDLSFGVKQGEIFALLGTNGAGKTTTLSILSGEFPQTSGVAILNGYDIRTDLRAAQRNLGYCPQFDALLELMTVEEHLRFYARLRGMPWEAIPNAVDMVLKHLGLSEYRNKRSKKLSGGNKRKLSMGIAIIGGPKVVFLDEPSAGMDPVARHQMCQSILGVAQGRSVILTTHHLEEVEALANRVGIMVAGRFRCLGTLQRLKTKFGEGYWLEFRVDDSHKRAVCEFVGSTFGAYSVEEEQPSFLRVKVTSPNLRLSVVFEKIEQERAALQIRDYSVSQPNLEQVFLRISADNDDETTHE
eukprot:TRINITY_DN394_c0_g1_i9.p1 TRINITY_DN394_c0_g1~~TRINITY_DN394_c0_g1_i9.p1  ORF type:complete len:1686 (-),score=308.54 TRINITY_DN394_c0_g1_i9:70-5127(-)